MTIDALRDELLHARQAAQGGDMDATPWQIDKVLEQMKPDHLLTSTEAARLLGLRSSNTILGWCRTGHLHGIRRGGRTMDDSALRGGAQPARPVTPWAGAPGSPRG